MSWIESHQSLATHKKLLRASALLHVDKYKLMGHLHCLWYWSLDNAEDDGSLGEALPEEIAEAAGWPVRKAKAFVGALVEVHFLDHGGGSYQLHNWYDYAGKLNHRRAENKERMQRARAPNVQDTEHTRVGLPTHTPTNQPTNLIDLKGTNGARTPAKDNPLNFTDAEWKQLFDAYPDLNVQSYWIEWVKWIEESRGSKSPSKKLGAFRGFLNEKRRQLSVAQTSVKS